MAKFPDQHPILPEQLKDHPVRLAVRLRLVSLAQEDFMRDFYDESPLEDLNFLAMDTVEKRKMLDAQLRAWMAPNPVDLAVRGRRIGRLIPKLPHRY